MEGDDDDGDARCCSPDGCWNADPATDVGGVGPKPDDAGPADDDPAPAPYGCCADGKLRNVARSHLDSMLSECISGIRPCVRNEFDPFVSILQCIIYAFLFSHIALHSNVKNIQAGFSNPECKLKSNLECMYTCSFSPIISFQLSRLKRAI